ncbi:MAG: MFS transporter [Chloroflexota bacterium]
MRINRFRRSGLWRHGDFVKLWTGETVSVFGSLVGHSALSFTAVLVLHASALEVGVLAAAHLVPDILFGLVAGVWVDRLRRRPLMIIADVGRFVALATIPLAYAFDQLSIGQLFAVAFFTGTFEIFFDVSYQAYLPSLVEKENILEGNSKMAASQSVAEVAGFGISGWLVQIFNGPIAVLVDAVSFLASAFALITIGKSEPEPPPVEHRTGVREEIVEGGRAIARNPILRSMLVAHDLSGFAFRMYGAVFLLYVVDIGFKPGVLGLVWGVGGATSLIGAMYAGRAAKRLGLGPALSVGLAGMGVMMFLIPAARDASFLALLATIGAQFGDGVYMIWQVNSQTLRQSITAPELLGRVTSGYRVSNTVAMLLGALAGGVAGELIGLRATLTVASAIMVASGAWLIVTPVWSMRAAPAPAGSHPEPIIVIGDALGGVAGEG